MNNKTKKVLITGGLGMIGSTIAHKLLDLGHEVTLLDSMISPFGANFFNIENIKNKIVVNVSDIRDKESLKHLVMDKDIIFNLAGQVSHNDSLVNPYLDTDINYIGHLNVLEAVKNHNPQAKVIHSGSRLQFGKILSNPVNESHPLNPLTPYAVNKTAAENLYLYYNRVFGIPVVLFRIANPYGPRCQMLHSKYAIINWFIRKAMDNEEILIFGDGSQIRDYIFVDDLADSMIATALNQDIQCEIFNIGSGQGTTFKEMTDCILQEVGCGKVKHIPWPKDFVNVETGDYITDISKIKKQTSWLPKITLADGIKKTVEYYRVNKSNYW